jgi:hypothetical protein
MNTAIDTAARIPGIQTDAPTVKGFDPIDWEAETRTMIDQVCNQYIAWGQDAETVNTELRPILIKSMLGDDKIGGYVNNGSLRDAALYILEKDPVVGAHYLEVTGKEEGNLEVTPSDAKAAAADQLRAQILTLIQLEATACTGLMAPDLDYNALKKAEDAEKIKEGELREPFYTDDCISELRLDVPLKIPEDVRKNAMTTVEDILSGDVMLAFITNTHTKDVSGSTISVNEPSNTCQKYDGSKAIPVIQMYMVDTNGTDDTSDDSPIYNSAGAAPGQNGSTVLRLAHEGIHAIDDNDGTPLTTLDANGRAVADPRDGFISEYAAYYNEVRMFNFDRRENHTLLEKFATNLDSFSCKHGESYDYIADLYQSDPSFAARVDLIHNALIAHKDITPELAAQIIYAESDTAAKAIVDATPEALNTAPDNPVCD